MNRFWSEFKEGCIEAVGSFGALIVLLGSIVWGLVIVIVMQLTLWIVRACGVKHHTYSAIVELRLRDVDFLVSITDSYMYWYEKITTSIKNLVK